MIKEVLTEGQKEVKEVNRDQDSGLAESENSGLTDSVNSGTSAGNIKVENHIIILFKALNAKPAIKESTFVSASSTVKGSCNISVINPVDGHNTISDDGKENEHYNIRRHLFFISTITTV